MLGSDPVRQYDEGLGNNRQGVITLEPVYKFGGGDSAWVDWYFKEFVKGNAMKYAYTQAGQENSFTWDAMAKGFELQLPLIARLRNEHKITIQTLQASGEWFRKKYKVTPATSVTVTKDIAGSDRKTVWFNSRFYRMNLLWENGNLRFRDIHLFNEDFPSVYTKDKATSNECSFFTLPFVDGYLWSSPDKFAGLRFKAMVDGKEILLEGKDPVITDSIAGKLHIVWPLKSTGQQLVMDIDERQMQFRVTGAKPLDWFLELTTATKTTLPFKEITAKKIDCTFEGMAYSVTTSRGNFIKGEDGVVLKMNAEKGLLVLNLVGKE